MDGWLTAADSTRLYWQAWTPAEPRATVLLVHGLAEHGGRYAHVGERLAAAGYAVYALDHRGHGRSDGARAMIGRLDTLVDDVHGFSAQVSPGATPFMIGHSMGGAVALRYAIRHPGALRGLVVSGAAVAVDGAPPPLRMLAALLSRVAPGLRIQQLDAGLVSRDPEVVRAYREDPLNYNGRIPARTLAEILAGTRSIPRDAHTISTPLLLLHGGDDGLCPPRGSRAVHAATASTLTVYDGLYHEIFNEPERERVLDDVVAWLAAHEGA